MKRSQSVSAALIMYRSVRHADLEVSHIAASISNSGKADTDAMEIGNKREKCVAKQTTPCHSLVMIVIQ